MLEPWAEISERLRRIHKKSKLMQYLDYRLPYVSKITASKGASCIFFSIDIFNATIPPQYAEGVR